MADNNFFNNGNPADGGYRNTADADAQQKQNETVMNAVAATSAMQHGFGLGSGMAALGAPAAPAEEGRDATMRFNITIGLMLLYGFVVNAILCFVFTDAVMAVPAPVAVIGYFVLAFVGMAICHKTENPVVGFIGYNFIVIPMGILLTPMLTYVRFETIRYAFCVMGVITVLVIGAAYLYPQFFLSIGKMLLSCLVIGLIAELILWCFGLTSGVLDFAFVGIFSAYIGYDWAIAQQKPKTTPSAIRCAYMMYVDLINLLIRLIRILAKNRD